MLACARIGAIHSVVFAGFSSNSLRDRIVDSHARFIFTSNEGVRGGRKVPLLATVNDAVKDLKIDRIFIHRRTDKDPIGLVEGRDVWLHEATAIERPYCPPEWLDSEDPLFYLYTSGSSFLSNLSYISPSRISLSNLSRVSLSFYIWIRVPTRRERQKKKKRINRKAKGSDPYTSRIFIACRYQS